MRFREEFAKIRAEISQNPHAQAFDELKAKLNGRSLILYGAGAVAGMALKVANMIWNDVRNSGRSKFKRQVKMAPEIVVRNSCGTL